MFLKNTRRGGGQLHTFHAILGNFSKNLDGWSSIYSKAGRERLLAKPLSQPLLSLHQRNYFAFGLGNTTHAESIGGIQCLDLYLDLREVRPSNGRLSRPVLWCQQVSWMHLLWGSSLQVSLLGFTSWIRSLDTRIRDSGVLQFSICFGSVLKTLILNYAKRQTGSLNSSV